MESVSAIIRGCLTTRRWEIRAAPIKKPQNAKFYACFQIRVMSSAIESSESWCDPA